MFTTSFVKSYLEQIRSIDFGGDSMHPVIKQYGNKLVMVVQADLLDIDQSFKYLQDHFLKPLGQDTLSNIEVGLVFFNKIGGHVYRGVKSHIAARACLEALIETAVSSASITFNWGKTNTKDDTLNIVLNDFLYDYHCVSQHDLNKMHGLEDLYFLFTTYGCALSTTLLSNIKTLMNISATFINIETDQMLPSVFKHLPNRTSDLWEEIGMVDLELVSEVKTNSSVHYPDGQTKTIISFDYLNDGNGTHLLIEINGAIILVTSGHAGNFTQIESMESEFPLNHLCEMVGKELLEIRLSENVGRFFISNGGFKQELTLNFSDNVVLVPLNRIIDYVRDKAILEGLDPAMVHPTQEETNEKILEKMVIPNPDHLEPNTQPPVFDPANIRSTEKVVEDAGSVSENPSDLHAAVVEMKVSENIPPYLQKVIDEISDNPGIVQVVRHTPIEVSNENPFKEILERNNESVKKIVEKLNHKNSVDKTENTQGRFEAHSDIAKGVALQEAKIEELKTVSCERAYPTELEGFHPSLSEETFKVVREGKKESWGLEAVLARHDLTTETPVSKPLDSYEDSQVKAVFYESTTLTKMLSPGIKLVIYPRVFGTIEDPVHGYFVKAFDRLGSVLNVMRLETNSMILDPATHSFEQINIDALNSRMEEFLVGTAQVSEHLLVEERIQDLDAINKTLGDSFFSISTIEKEWVYGSSIHHPTSFFSSLALPKVEAKPSEVAGFSVDDSVILPFFSVDKTTQGFKDRSTVFFTMVENGEKVADAVYDPFEVMLVNNESYIDVRMLYLEALGGTVVCLMKDSNSRTYLVNYKELNNIVSKENLDLNGITNADVFAKQMEQVTYNLLVRLLGIDALTEDKPTPAHTTTLNGLIGQHSVRIFRIGNELGVIETLTEQ